MTGRSGHGSIPIPDSATNRLIAALNRLRQWQPPLELTPPMEHGFVSLAPYVAEPWRSRLEHMDQFIREPNAREELEREHPGWLAMLTNTVSITQLEGSKKINVIGPEATASLDCRLLPGTEIDSWVGQIRKVLDDPSIKIDVVLNFPTSHSPDDSALVEAIREAVKQQYPGAGVIYTPLEAFTDSSGRARFEGLPNAPKKPLAFEIRYGDRRKTQTDNPLDTCKASYDVVLP